MRLEVESPFYPKEIQVDAEFIMGDPSERRESGLKVIISWTDRLGDEWGTEQFISEKQLVGWTEVAPPKCGHGNCPNRDGICWQDVGRG